MYRHRLRNRIKWMSLGFAVLCAALWFVSLEFMIKTQVTSHIVMAFGGGCLVYGRGDSPAFEDVPSYEITTMNTSTSWWGSEWQLVGSASGVVMPLWPLVGVSLITFACLHRLDRRPPVGHCQGCGYNLAGNVSGVCSECGREL